MSTAVSLKALEIPGKVTQVKMEIPERGHYYEGDWLDPPGVAHGKGKYIWEDGARYEGDWKMGLADGFGVKAHPNGQLFEGMWKKDLQHGEGKCMYPDGTTFQGNFNKGMKDGKGTLTFPDGSTYVGSFYKDLMHGKSVFKRLGIGIFEGEFENNNMKLGKFTAEDGVVYDGQWSRNKQHGWGIAYKEEEEGKRLGYWISGRPATDKEFLNDLMKDFPQAKKERPLHYALSTFASKENIFHFLKLCPDDVKKKDRAGLLPIHTASYKGASVEVIEKLVKLYPEGISVRTMGGGVPLHSAIFGRASFETTIKLLEHFPEATKIITKNGNTCLALASYKGLTRLVPLFLALDPTAIDRKNTKKETPRSLAKDFGHRDVSKLLRDERKTINEFKYHLKKGGIEGLTWDKFMVWAKKVMPPDTYKTWAEKKESAGAGVSESKNSVDRIVQSVVQTDWMNFKSNGNWALEKVKELLRSNPSAAREEDECGSMLLHWAVYMDAPLETVQFIYNENKSAVRVPGNSGHLPLHFTIFGFETDREINFDVVQYLFDAFEEGAIAKTSKGNTFMHMMCQTDRAVPTEWLEMLMLKYPHSASVKNDNGLLPIHLLAEHCRSKEQLDLLVNTYPKGVQEADQTNKWIPLHYAASVGNLVAVQLLLKAFAPGVHELDSEGNTPLKLAMNYKSLSVSRDREEVIALLETQKSAAMDHARMILRQVLLSGDSQPWMRSKLMLVGEGRAGKTSTLRSLMGEAFRENEMSTIGATTKTCTVNKFNVKINRDNTVQPWKEKVDQQSEFDTAVAKLVKKGLQKKKAEMLVSQNQLRKKQVGTTPTAASVELHDSASLRSNETKSEGSQQTLINDSLSIDQDLDRVDKGSILVSSLPSGSKGSESMQTPFSDHMEQTPVRRIHTARSPEQRAEEIINNYGDVDIQNLLQGAENTLKLGIWDYGGQEIFYAVHHLFLTRFGVYLVLFDMRKILKPETRSDSINFIRFWLNSIALYARSSTDNGKEESGKGSPIFLIGSHKDVVPEVEEHKNISDILTRTFGANIERQNIQRNEKEGICFFPMDNTAENDCNVIAVRQCVEKVIAKEEYIMEEYPIAWMTVCDELKNKSQEDAYLTLEEVYELALECGIKDTGGDPDASKKSWVEVNAMLAHFHQLGVIVYYGHRQGLDQLIILNPQWIVDRISDVIREFSSQSFTHSRGRDKFAKEMNEEWSDLTKKGVLSKRLLRHLWRGDHRHVDFLLTLMQTFALICPLKIPTAGALLLQYMVPSLLPSKMFPLKENRRHDIEIAFGVFLPTGIFGRLVVVMLEYYFSETIERYGSYENRMENVAEKASADGAQTDPLIRSLKENGPSIYKTWCAFNFHSKGSLIISMRQSNKDIVVYFLDDEARMNCDEIFSVLGKLINTLNIEFYNSQLNILLTKPNEQKASLALDLSKSWHRPRLDILTARRSTASAYLTGEAKAKGYYTVPNLEDLSSDGDVAHIENFVVGRKGYGKIKWLCPVNLSEAGAIDDIVFIERGDVSVYEFHKREPKQGYELNCSAQIEFENFFPPDKDDDTRTARFLRRMKKIERNGGYDNCEYNAETGTWRFEVQHFTIQGWNAEDNELIEWILNLLWLPRRHDRNRDQAKDYAEGLLKQDYYLEEIIGDPPPPHDDWSPASDPPSIPILEAAGFRPLHIRKVVRVLAALYPTKREYQGVPAPKSVAVATKPAVTVAPAVKAAEKSPTTSVSGYDVFLSHDWGKFTIKGKDGKAGVEIQNHDRVKRINEGLKAVGLETWFDEDRMSGNINDQMVSGIDNSSCFLAFITNNYILKVSGEGPNGKADNCKKEFEYGERRKTAKRMIPILIEPSAWNTKMWKGSVGMCLGGELYFKMDEADVWEDNVKFNEAISKLADKVKTTILSCGNALVNQKKKAKSTLQPASTVSAGGGSGPATSKNIVAAKLKTAGNQALARPVSECSAVPLLKSSAAGKAISRPSSESSAVSLAKSSPVETTILDRTSSDNSTSTVAVTPKVSATTSEIPKTTVPEATVCAKSEEGQLSNTTSNLHRASSAVGSGLNAVRNITTPR